MEQPSGIVLILDDEPIITQLLARVLHAHGYRTAVANSCRVAESIVAANRVGLLICDVIMPHENGPGFVQRLEDLGFEAPVLFMSGYSRDDIAGDHRLAQERHFLRKPFNVKELLEALEDLMPRAKAC